MPELNHKSNQLLSINFTTMPMTVSGHLDMHVSTIYIVIKCVSGSMPGWFWKINHAVNANYAVEGCVNIFIFSYAKFMRPPIFVFPNVRTTMYVAYHIKNNRNLVNFKMIGRCRKLSVPLCVLLCN